MEIDYKEKLTELFYNTISDRKIDETIRLVLEEENCLDPNEKLEGMINLLIDCTESIEEEPNVNDDGFEEGAVGFSRQSSRLQFNPNYDRLLNLFPDISFNFLTDFCKKYNDLDSVIEELSKIDYVKVEKDPLDVCEHLKKILPNADPIYLRNQARVLVNRPPRELDEFIEKAIENNDYPTMQQYLIDKELATDVAVYVNNFSVVEYLKRVPRPLETFQDPNRKPTLLKDPNEEDVEYALNFLYNQFTYQRKKDIERVFICYNKDLIKACNKLKILPKAFRHPRIAVELKQCKNLELLKEIAFLQHEKSIRQHIKRTDDRYRAALEEARLHGLLQTCNCCFDDQLIPEECVFCEKGCAFCKECVKSGAEHVIGKEETVFPCLASCDSEFHYSTLQMVLDEKVFRGVWHRRQMEEIMKANIDGLETCPFCDFCMIPDEGDKIFKCGNINCMRETCRLCRHESHVPLRCEEIEYDEDVKIRTEIEKEMTEALLRKCWKCSKQFYKESGCNKMTCVCGAKMCYYCGQAVQDYAHFNERGCPLYTDNLQQFHLNRVRQAGAAAKQKLGINQDPKKLKFDPMRGIETDVQ